MLQVPSVGNTFILLGQRLADASGAVIRRYFRAQFTTQTKSDQSPVTIADKEAEQAIRKILEKERPKDSIQGEEFGTDNKDSEFLWVIDPIDGTKSFATGRPIFGTLIALYRGDEPIMGILDQPITRERWVGAKGHATTLNGRAVKCRPCDDLKAAQVATLGPDYFESDATWKRFQDIARASAFAIYGGDCYSYGQVATGFLDSVIDERMHLHDFAALVPIVEGAGGKITDWQGKPLGRKQLSPVIASGDAKLHDKLCAMMTG